MSTTSEETPAAAIVPAGEKADAILENDDDAKQVKKLFAETRVDGGKKSVWEMTLETLHMSDAGKSKKEDRTCQTAEQALVQLQTWVQEKKDWEFATTPFDEFRATKEDLLQAFVHWSRKGGKETDKEDSVSYNVSQAFRRLESYVEWMDKNCQTLDLRGRTMKEIHQAWNMRLTHDKHGRLIWWIDVDIIDLKHIKHNLSTEDSLRYFVWLSHLVLFDKSAQVNGMTIVNGIGNKRMIDMLTCISMDLGTKLDRLTIGILPVKMESYIMFKNPAWVAIVVMIMKPFLTKKMRQRIKTLKSKHDPQAYFEEEFGKEGIPVGIEMLTGVVETDLIEEALAKQ